MPIILDGSAGITFPDTKIQAQARPDAPQSMIKVHTGNGYGSTNTMILRFVTNQISQGADITYADSATLGASFTINTSGVYAMNVVGSFLSALAWIGISLNSSQLTTAIPNISQTDRIALSYSSTVGGGASAGATMYLASGTVIRAHGDATSSTANGTSFIITRVA